MCMCVYIYFDSPNCDLCIISQKFEIEPCTDCDEEKEQEKRLVSFEERTIKEEKIL